MSPAQSQVSQQPQTAEHGGPGELGEDLGGEPELAKPCAAHPGRPESNCGLLATETTAPKNTESDSKQHDTTAAVVTSSVTVPTPGPVTASVTTPVTPVTSHVTSHVTSPVRSAGLSSESSPLRLAASEGGDTWEEERVKHSEEDINVDVDLNMIAPFTGFYFGASADDDANRSHFFEQVHDASLPTALRPPEADSKSVGSEPPDETVDELELPPVIEEEVPVHDGDKDSAGGQQQQGVDTHGPELVDISNARWEWPEVAVKESPADIHESFTADVLPELLQDVDKSRENDVGLELMEIARVSTALTAASSSVPDSESLPMFDDQDEVELVGGQEETAEGAGDDSLNVDLRPVAGGLFDPTADPSQPLVGNQLVKGSSLPAATAVSHTQRPTSGRSDRVMAAFGRFPFKVKRRQEPPKGDCTSRVEGTGTSPCVDPPEVLPRPNCTDDTATVITNQLESTAAMSAHEQNVSISSDPNKKADTKSEKPSVMSTHRGLTDVLQGLKQAILPRIAGTSKRKNQRNNAHIKKDQTSAVSTSDDDVPKPLSTEKCQRNSQSEALHALACKLSRTKNAEDTTLHTDAGETSGRATETPREENSDTAELKKNHVKASLVPEMHQDTKYSLSAKSSVSHYPPRASDTRSRSSRASIAPPRTNFLTDDVLRSLTRPSHIRCSDISVRSNQRIAGKTPERYRNIPPPMKRAESLRSNISNSTNSLSIKSVPSKKGSTYRKLLKESDHGILDDRINGAISTKGHSDIFIVQEEMSIVPVAQNSSTGTRNSEKKSNTAKKVNKFQKQPIRTFKRGLSSPDVVISKSTLPTWKKQSSTSNKISKVSEVKPTKQVTSYPKTENIRPKRSQLSTVGLTERKVSSSPILLQKNKHPESKRIELSDPSDSVAEIAVEGNSINTDTCPQFSSEVNSSRTWDERISSELLSSTEKRDDSNASREGSSSLPQGSSAAPSSRKRTTTVPRYRQTLRTPRISYVGMNAISEALKKKNEKSTVAISRARDRFKHSAKLARGLSLQSEQDHKKNPEKIYIESRCTDTTKPMILNNKYADLHEVTRMLYQYASLTAARGSFSSASEMVSLFEAQTIDSLPSEESQSGGGLCVTTRPSIDEVLERVKRFNNSSTFILKPELTPEATRVATLSNPKVNSDAPPCTLSCDGIEPPTPESFIICSSKTEAKVAAALQEILISLTDLKRSEESVNPNLEITKELSDPACSVEPTTITGHSSIKPPPPVCGIIFQEPGTQSNEDGGPTVQDVLNNCQNDGLLQEAEHLHSLHYIPSQKLSSFDTTESAIVVDYGNCLSNNHASDIGNEEDGADDLSHKVKRNTWTILPILTRVESLGIQVKVPTADADCQKGNSPQHKSEEICSDVSDIDDYQEAQSESQHDLDRANIEPVSDLKVTRSSHHSNSGVVNSETSRTNQDDLDDLLELLVPTDMSYVPRSHHDLIRPHDTRSRNSVRPSSETYAEPTTTGLERAQKRIACLLGDDLPQTVLAVLTEVK